MDMMVEIDRSNQGITLDERKFLSQLFDNIWEENLAVSDFYDVQSLSESRNL
jgi:hypothetical protein